MTIFEKANETDWNSVLFLAGIAPSRHQNKICCPFHREQTASCHLYNDHFFCFGCGGTGDKIKFLSSLISIAPLEAAQRLSGEKKSAAISVNLQYSDAIEKSRKNKSIQWIRDLYDRSDELGKSTMAYCKSRGLSECAVKIFGISETEWWGHQRLIIPDFASTGLSNICGRGLDPELKPKYLFPKNRGDATFGFHVDAEIDLEQILICEGWLDAISSYEMGEPAVAIGGSNYKAVARIRAKKWIVVYDQDDAGYETALKIGRIGRDKGADVTFRNLQKGKDLNDLLISYKLKEPPNPWHWYTEMFMESDGRYTPSPKSLYHYALKMIHELEPRKQ